MNLCMPQHTCRRQRTTFRLGFYPFTMWLLETQLGSSDLAARQCLYPLGCPLVPEDFLSSYLYSEMLAQPFPFVTHSQWFSYCPLRTKSQSLSRSPGPSQYQRSNLAPGIWGHQQISRLLQHFITSWLSSKATLCWVALGGLEWPWVTVYPMGINLWVLNGKVHV